MRKETTMNFSILLIAAEYIAITYIFGLLYKLVGWRNSAYIQRNLGWTGYCVLGSVGVMFHELPAPDSGAMSRVIRESLSCPARFRFTEDGRVLFDGESAHASYEWV
jgi:hypothetical protein